jgi:GNAT superfamily N-acetyltransferase
VPDVLIQVDAITSPLDARAVSEVLGLLGAEPYKNAIWNWQFRQRADGAAFFGVAGRDQSGSIVAFNGAMPVTARMNGKRVGATWSCDFVVAAAARGAGLGKKLKSVLAAHSAPLLALGISDVAASVHSSMQWTTHAGCNLYTRLNLAPGWKVRAKWVLQGIMQLASWPVRLRDPGGTTAVRGIAESIPALDEIWRRVETGYDWAVCRDADYLRWRYAQHPLARYEVILFERAGVAHAAGIFWRSGARAALVDYVGPRDDFGAKLAIVTAFVTVTTDCTARSCTTSDLQLGRALHTLGFLSHAQRQLRFSTFAPRGSAGAAPQSWFLMGGDSDGDILAATRAFTAPRVESIERLDDAMVRATWSSVHSEAPDLDRLFNSWEWQSSWWQNFAAANRLELRAMSAHSPVGGTVGIAPLYLHVGRRFGLPCRRLQLIGNIWGGPSTMRSEYLDFIASPAWRDQAVRAFLDEIERRRDWDELVLTDVDCSSATCEAIRSHRLAQHCLVRNFDEDDGYRIDTSGGFDAFLASLPSSSRRRIFLQRGKLAAGGPITLEVDTGDRFTEFAQRLDRLHQMRWGTSFFSAAMLKFHGEFLRKLQGSGECRISLMRIGDRDISALYNVRIQNVEYNLQGGFDADAARGVSVGSIHLGFAIESACVAGIDSFELLVGRGKFREFKRDFAQQSRHVRTLQLVRGPLLASLYRVRDAAKAARSGLRRYAVPAPAGESA